MANKDIDSVVTLLRSHVKLERDRGLQCLEEMLKNSSEFSSDVGRVDELQCSLTALVSSIDRGWEAKHGGLLGAKCVLLNKLGSDVFCDYLRKHALILMHDEEARVRIASGKS